MKKFLLTAGLLAVVTVVSLGGEAHAAKASVEESMDEFDTYATGDQALKKSDLETYLKANAAECFDWDCADTGAWITATLAKMGISSMDLNARALALHGGLPATISALFVDDADFSAKALLAGLTDANHAADAPTDASFIKKVADYIRPELANAIWAAVPVALQDWFASAAAGKKVIEDAVGLSHDWTAGTKEVTDLIKGQIAPTWTALGPDLQANLFDDKALDIAASWKHGQSVDDVIKAALPYASVPAHLQGTLFADEAKWVGVVKARADEFAFADASAEKMRKLSLGKRFAKPSYGGGSVGTAWIDSAKALATASIAAGLPAIPNANKFKNSMKTLLNVWDTIEGSTIYRLAHGQNATVGFDLQEKAATDATVPGVAHNAAAVADVAFAAGIALPLPMAFLQKIWGEKLADGTTDLVTTGKLTPATLVAYIAEQNAL